MSDKNILYFAIRNNMISSKTNVNTKHTKDNTNIYGGYHIKLYSKKYIKNKK